MPDRPGLRWDTSTSEGKKAKGNGIKGQSSLNTKDGWGRGSAGGDAVATKGLLHAKHRRGDGDKASLQERTGSPRWSGGMAFQQPTQHCHVRQMHFPRRRGQPEGFCCVTWPVALIPVPSLLLRLLFTPAEPGAAQSTRQACL